MIGPCCPADAPRPRGPCRINLNTGVGRGAGSSPGPGRAGRPPRRPLRLTLAGRPDRGPWTHPHHRKLDKQGARRI
jgi:hypothetical protein